MNKSPLLTGLQWLWLTLTVLVINLSIKYLFLQNFALGDRVPLLPFFDLYYVCNYGAAFSLLARGNGWQRWFLITVSISICIVLLIIMYRTKATQRLINASYALIIGGALGNLLDRLWHGFVVDMIDFYIGDWHFATFNFDDCAICIGTALVILESFLSKIKTKE